MQAKTILIQTEIPECRAVIAHFLQIVYADDGKEVGRAKLPHTVTILPDADLDWTLSDVNQDITTRKGMKWAAIEPEEWARAVGHCAVEHTPEVKAAYALYKGRILQEIEERAAQQPTK